MKSKYKLPAAIAVSMPAPCFIDYDEPPLKDSRHERFAVLVASGQSKRDAYRATYPKSRGWSPKMLDNGIARLMHRDDIQERILGLQRAAVTSATMSAAELQLRLSDVIRNGHAAGDWKAVVGAGRLLASIGGFRPTRQQTKEAEDLRARIEGAGHHVPFQFANDVGALSRLYERILANGAEAGPIAECPDE